MGRWGSPEEHRRMLFSKKSYATFSKHYNVSYPSIHKAKHSSDYLSKYWKLGKSLTLLKWTNQIPALKPLTGGLWVKSHEEAKVNRLSSVQLLSHVRLFATTWIAACQAPLSITNSQSLLKPMSIKLVMHPAISSSVVPFSSCPQSFPASGSFPLSQLFASGGPSIGVSDSASVLPMNTQDWLPLEWTGWISLKSKGLSRVFSNTTVQKHQFFSTQLSSQSNSHIHTWHWKNHSLDQTDLCWQSNVSAF